MSMRTIGVMGSGGHLVTGHLPFLGNARVAGIYDPDVASRQAASTVLGYTPSSFATPEDLVTSRPDAILIGSPDKFHPEQLLLVVKAGIPVLCEKPLAVDATGLHMVQEALERAHAAKLLVASCHQRRTMITDLPYGWVRHNLANLEKRFGSLKFIRLNSNYPQPQRQWKHDRSFLADKFVHDIDYLRVLLGNGAFWASREFDRHDHYIVSGNMAYRNSHVGFTCEGTRLHNDRDAFIEYIMLNFEHGDCVVYTKTGVVRYHDRRTDSSDQAQVTPMVPGSYDLQNQEVTQNFVNSRAVHTAGDLLVNTAAVVALAGPAAHYQG
jgi:predicted dehydrogenase